MDIPAIPAESIDWSESKLGAYPERLVTVTMKEADWASIFTVLCINRHQALEKNLQLRSVQDLAQEFANAIGLAKDGETLVWRK